MSHSLGSSPVDPLHAGSWFTIRQLDDATYAISETGHWERVNSYLALGERSALLIDSGLGIGNIRREVEALTSLPVSVVATHVHWDHIGGHGLFRDIMVHAGEVDWLVDGLPIPLAAVRADVVREPFSREPPASFDIDSYEVYRGRPSRVLENGDLIDLGRRKLRVIHTPGHSPGHMCFHEEDRGYLYTGDLVYLGTLYAFYPSTDPGQFMQSVTRIAELKPVGRILPGHGDLDVPIATVGEMRQALARLDREGLVRHGAGTFDYGSFAFRF